ncbi:MAG: demethoxyubiquinone hydroxylase family protein [Sphingomonadales bacterium]|nr:demethoxyubiquinone hydroxylase family protein [Sphingomonadales bacterium]MDE2170035.1 demethoxyubiquinone hydroxylase family protein [Sphingomonadales bacterium]
MSSKPLSKAVERMIRVDQAGEYGAVRIYAGQMAVMGDRGPHAGRIAHMAEQEVVHREWFDGFMAERGARPTLLQPVWHVAGFALGAATALIGPEAAMACTAAIETEIDLHYTRQLEVLGQDEPEIAEKIARARDEEREHRDIAFEQGAEKAPAYPLLSGAIRLGCRMAIALSERI